MANYTFWDTNCGVDPVVPGSNLEPNPEVTVMELASYIVTDWQPYGYASESARAVVREFLELIIVGDGGRWVMKRQSQLLTRGWKGMISEAIGIAFSRHSARVTKGYNFCVHTDHFLKSGVFHSDNFRVERLSDQVLRPDYLLAARRFPARRPGAVIDHVTASLEVKGTARNIRGQVSARQKTQSENIRLILVNGEDETLIPLQQNLLSLVRANSSLVTEAPRAVDVRHANNYFPNLSFADNRNELFLIVVLAHYFRIFNRMTNFQFSLPIKTVFRYPIFPRRIFPHRMAAELLSALKKTDEEQMVSLSDPLIEFLEALLRGNLLFAIQKSRDLHPIDKHLERMEKASETLTTDEVYCRPDGFVFRLPQKSK